MLSTDEVCEKMSDELLSDVEDNAVVADALVVGPVLSCVLMLDEGTFSVCLPVCLVCP